MKYNGHKNYNAWNISLWINNDEGLYDLVKYCFNLARIRAADAGRAFTKAEAVNTLMDYLPGSTPDGVKYTKTNLFYALRGFK